MGIIEEVEQEEYEAQRDEEAERKRRARHERMTICVDFDGVVHQYVSGWQGSHIAADPPVEGAFDWLRMMIDESFNVVIYSSRSKEHDGIDTMKKWFEQWGMEKRYLVRLGFPKQKPNAFLLIDDRGFHFKGEFPSVEYIENFKVWNKP